MLLMSKKAHDSMIEIKSKENWFTIVRVTLPQN